MNSGPSLVVVANTRLPSERAQALQVVQSAAAFARAGANVDVLHARRARELTLAPGEDLFTHYEVPAGPRPKVTAVPCVDWIERVPVALQYAPARLQELSFSRNAARTIRERHANSWVLSREIECARELARAGHKGLFLELHRVPGGGTRRRWLFEAARGAAGFVAISGGVREDLVALGLAPEAIEVAHDGFESERFANLSSREEARRELRLDPAARVVVYTGGLMEWKGVEVLVDAARRLPDITFVIAGGAREDLERVRSHASGLANVRFDGFQPPTRVALYLRSADVGVVPNRSKPEISARYTSPLKVFEAMACGLPLVASDLPSLRELLHHGVDAWLVAPDDPEKLAEGLRRLLDDRELRQRLADSFAARAAAHTWDARARQLLDWMARRVR
ncbi:MAG: glycosyltransferase family 4 protein [Planctomycetaceae bacterium]|nr:glycosyltransferase family 4 protein [Planctomycetaceae bacterium]